MLLELTDIHLSMDGAGGPVSILRGVDAGFAQGRSAAIVGPSGSGKTTFLMICAGLLKPDCGRVVFNGADITGHDEDALAQLRRDEMGIIFQNFHLIPTMTALENVAIPLELAGVAHARSLAETGLRDVGLGARLAHYPAQLSGGEQQRVAIARALAMKPKLIMADEPTGNLDQETGQVIMSLLFERVKAQGATLILITHDMALAAACDEQVHFRDGKVVAA
jgi:putative ABC transport system ATP-binding protein